MKTALLLFWFPLLLLSSCSEGKAAKATFPSTVKEQLQKLSATLTEAEKNDDLRTFLAYYDEKVISMPECQPTLQGRKAVETYYREIFDRQKIKNFTRKTDEIIPLGKTIVELGTFTKEYTSAASTAMLTQKGKYWHIWEEKPDGTYKLKGEAYGYFHPVEDPAALAVPKTQITAEPGAALKRNIPFELKAYNALMEKGVRNRDGLLRSEFFTNDARFMPFQEPNVAGIDQIKPYLIAYSSRGNVKVDPLTVETYHAEYFDNHVLEYDTFSATWTGAESSGKAEGKGIRIWQRQADKSLRIYREIGTHNHLE